MKNILLYLWQLPQHLVALVILLFNRHSKITVDGITIYIVYSFESWGAGVSLGQYILLAPIHVNKTTVHHEYGHSIQSKWLGPLYLLTVGIVSVSRNIYDRIYHKGVEWYYGSWPENQADKLGGLTR